MISDSELSADYERDVEQHDYGAPAAPLFEDHELAQISNGLGSGTTPSYAAAAAVSTQQEPAPPVISVVDEENLLPSRPCTAIINPRARITHGEFFEALELASVDPQSVSCIQRRSNGELVLTFRNAQQREAFLAKNVISIRGQPFALQDADKPLTYLQIFDAPYEMPDSTIINRLQKYCDVIHHRRGYFREEGFKHIQDGLRHYRVRINQPIPNFLRFGSLVLTLRYSGQPRTCRHCNLRGHLMRECTNLICFNCEQLGHQAATCPETTKCNLCKSSDHKAKHCPFSWSRSVPTPNSTPAETPSAENSAANSPPEPSLQPETSCPPENVSPPATSAEAAEILYPPGDTSQGPSTATESIPCASEEIPPQPPESVELFPENSASQSPETPPETDQHMALPDEDETLDTESSSDELFSESQSLPNSGRLPAKILDTFVPGRKPTQPTLVTGLKASKNHPLETEEPKAKRTKKHKKSRDRK